jgi:hypothetical protein
MFVNQSTLNFQIKTPFSQALSALSKYLGPPTRDFGILPAIGRHDDEL